jgi:hypothetical protein
VSHRKGVSYRNEATRERYGQSARGAGNRLEFRGFETRDRQAPAVTRPGPAETTSQQASGATRQGIDRSRERSAFGGIEGGSDVQRQSDRGRQSRQSTSSRGTGGVSRGNVGRSR